MRNSIYESCSYHESILGCVLPTNGNDTGRLTFVLLQKKNVYMGYLVLVYLPSEFFCGAKIKRLIIVQVPKRDK